MLCLMSQVVLAFTLQDETKVSVILNLWHGTFR